MFILKDQTALYRRYGESRAGYHEGPGVGFQQSVVSGPGHDACCDAENAGTAATLIDIRIHGAELMLSVFGFLSTRCVV